MIKGIGIDLVEIDRFKNILGRWGDRFLKRVFSSREIERYRNSPSSLAGRFASKEAFLKALGIGFGKVKLRDIEILEDSSGKPIIYHPFAVKALVSITHTKNHAISVVIVLE